MPAANSGNAYTSTTCNTVNTGPTGGQLVLGADRGVGQQLDDDDLRAEQHHERSGRLVHGRRPDAPATATRRRPARL